MVKIAEAHHVRPRRLPKHVAPDGSQIDVVAVHRSEKLGETPRAVAQEESFDMIGGGADSPDGYRKLP